MNILNKVIIFLVGGLFIFSGLIKLNDPVGTQIKLEEYFEVFSEDLKEKPAQVSINGETEPIPADQIKETTLSKFFIALKPYALSIALLMSALEVILGVNLLTGYRLRFTLWLLLLMILFFTFLTYYSWAYDKVQDCGCFGDAIKLTPKQSFMKDVVLTALIGVLFFQRKRLVPNAGPKVGLAFNLVATALSFGLGLYATYYLPPIDFRAYKVGVSIPDQMEYSGEPQYGQEKYIYTNLDTQEEEVYNQWEEKLGDTLKYEFKAYEKPLLNPEVLPKITDFNVWNAEGDYTDSVFTGNKLLIIVEDVQKTDLPTFEEVPALVKNLDQMDVEVWLLSASSNDLVEALRHQYQLAIPAFSVDGKVLKTMARANPSFILLQEGVVKAKWPHRKMPNATSIKQLL
ncbi:MAG: BT_3928 family protein [Thermonemataceae bacterium]